MKKLIKSLVVIMFMLMITGCRENASNETANYRPQDLFNLIERTYENLDEEIPVTEEMEITNREEMLRRTGLRSADNIEYMVASQAMISVFPYTMVLIKVDNDANIDAMKQEIYDNIDFNYWICVGADKAIITNFGSVIMLVMGSEEQAGLIYAEFDRVTGNLGETLVRINDQAGFDDGFNGGFDLGEDALYEEDELTHE